MRKVQKDQIQIGEINVTDVEIDLKSRDEIPQLLLGVQNIYADKNMRETLFETLKKLIPDPISQKTGRPGMLLWRLYVLSSLCVNCNFDFDKTHELANNHRTLRQILGHGLVDDDYYYALQTIKDNFHLLTPEILKELNKIVIDAGHEVFGHQPNNPLYGKCDSFVVETDVHFPTDINLLLDAMNQVITKTARLCDFLNIPGWRQNRHNRKIIKRLHRIIQKMRRSTSTNETKKARQETKIKKAYNAYLDVAKDFLDRADEVIETITSDNENIMKQLIDIQKNIKHGRRQIDQTRRRVIDGEKIPHDEKVFSIFEEHTEWISKGKAGVPQELGLRVCVITDQYGLILSHQVPKKQTDDKVAIEIVKQTKALFPTFSGCSFDKGFYTPNNRKFLLNYLKKLVMPKKGRLAEADKKIEHDAEFIVTRRKHSAIESAINALENHGLDRCYDHGDDGFERYVALAMVARNLQILGRKLMEKERKSQQRRVRYNATRQRNLAAASSV